MVTTGSFQSTRTPLQQLAAALKRGMMHGSGRLRIFWLTRSFIDTTMSSTLAVRVEGCYAISLLVDSAACPVLTRPLGVFLPFRPGRPRLECVFQHCRVRPFPSRRRSRMRISSFFHTFLSTCATSKSF